MTDVLQKGRTLTRFGFSVYDIARRTTVEIAIALIDPVLSVMA
jgi:hypothetical protein